MLFWISASGIEITNSSLLLQYLWFYFAFLPEACLKLQYLRSEPLLTKEDPPQ